jgi:hypothetical protein
MVQPRHTPTLVRVPSPELSLWQSAVTEARADLLARGDVASPLVRADPYARAADAYAYERYEEARVVRARAPERHRLFSQILDLARRGHHPGGLRTEVEAIIPAVGTYSSRDPAFAEAVIKFVEWYGLLRRPPEYRDWTGQGRGDINYGVVQHRLPADARIGVIGDWGTGLADARALLEQLVADCRPTAIIHLGDVYYSGTPREAACNFANVLTAVFEAHPPGPPVFNLAGNHDYYAGGHGFYQQLDALDAGQAASYFCVRSEDDRWQLVGVDTGYNDRVPGIIFDRSYTAPGIHDSERAWLQHKLAGFPGRTLLFSHHQLFSANNALNGPESGRRRLNFNDDLYEAVLPHLDVIAMWMWGREHSLALYESGLDGIEKCRLVGCSAFEMGTEDDPYALKFPDVRRQPHVRLSIMNGWFSHGFAVIDLGQQAVEYYQFPSWSGAGPPHPPTLELLTTEALRG